MTTRREPQEHAESPPTGRVAPTRVARTVRGDRPSRSEGEGGLPPITTPSEDPGASGWWLAGATSFALLAFAANSVFCRAGLLGGSIDAGSFSAIRLGSGALALYVLVFLRRGAKASSALDPWGAAFLFAYAVPFSFAYLELATGTGALVLFGAVQVTMIGAGIWAGERLAWPRGVGLASALGGLGYLLLPGASAPSLRGTMSMLVAGVAWGLYSLRGRGNRQPVLATARNFLWATPLTLLVVAAVSVTGLDELHWSLPGVGWALASGIVASAGGYAVWYAVLPRLEATVAATIQLTVPLLAAVAGILLFQEPLTLRLAASGVLVLGGVGLVLRSGRQPE